MKNKYFFITALSILFCVAAADAKINIANEPTFPEIEGMSIAYNYPVYTGEDLWDYINGASDGYLTFHFQQLNIAEYMDANGHGVKAEVYQFPKAEDAYGIYATERSPDYHFVEIGAEGYAESTLVNFIAGNYYVKIIKEPGDWKAEIELTEIAKAVCHALAEKPMLPRALEIFPTEGKLPHSETFTASNVLGNEFLKDAFKAEYKVNDTDFSILLFERDRRDACVDILKKYYTYTKETMPAAWENGEYIIHDKYNGTIYFYLTDKVLFGITGTDDQDIINLYIERVVVNLE